MKPGMHVDNLHVERTSRFEQEKNGKDNIMIETMQWVRQTCKVQQYLQNVCYPCISRSFYS